MQHQQLKRAQTIKKNPTRQCSKIISKRITKHVCHFSTIAEIDNIVSDLPNDIKNTQKIAKLRNILKFQHNLDAFIIPTDDAHLSEYVSDADKRREYISEFAGSAGTCVVTQEELLLWTDARYFIQASHELPKTWTLMKQLTGNTPTISQYFQQKFKPHQRVGYDPSLFSIKSKESFESALKSHQIEFVPITADNPVDIVWNELDTKPSTPSNPILQYPLEYAGETVDSKLSRIGQAMKKSDASTLVVAALDEIAWLLNMRGTDIHCNPVFISYAVVTTNTKANSNGDITHSINLFVSEDAMKQSNISLPTDVIVHPYNKIHTFLSAHAQDLKSSQQSALPSKIWLDKTKCNAGLLAALGLDSNEHKEFILTDPNPITLMKAIKNETEIAATTQAHIRDGAAMVKFLSWFEQQYSTLPTIDSDPNTHFNSPFNEYTLALKLESFRKQQPNYSGLSFDTISSIGPNGSIIHYKPDEVTSSPLTSGQVFLLDSGGQYLDGTTDITRTFYIPSPQRPTPTSFQREMFTRVLKGHIDIATAVFPPKTSGPAIDAYARRYLWDVGVDVPHGIGHGVGAALNVHEGPHSISKPSATGAIALTSYLTPGMIVSNEPGYYQDGQFGIRIENLITVVPVETKYSIEFFGFKNLTMVPIDRTMIETSMLSPTHIAYFDQYHQQVKNAIEPLLHDNPDALEWLERNTQALQTNPF